MHEVVPPSSSKIEKISIEFPKRDQQLKDPSVRLVVKNSVNSHQGSWSFKKGSEGFHGNHKRIFGHISAIAFGILLP